MASPRAQGADRDYEKGFRDGRMDALLPRSCVRPPDDAGKAYLDGYAAGTKSVRNGADKAA